MIILEKRCMRGSESEGAMTMRPEGYLPRLLDATVERGLAGFGAVEVTGAKFCGKTWRSLAHGQSVVRIDDDAVRSLVGIQPELALEGESPPVIDEWQEVPRVWDAARRRVDETGNAKGGFLLAGSSTADMSKVSHSGAGRTARVRMRPMSLQESGDSDGSVSLAGLFYGEFAPGQAETDIRDISQLICRGGWPAALGLGEDLAGDLPPQYLSALFEVSAPKRGLDPRMARRVATALARNMGRTATYRTLYADVFAEEPPSGMDNSQIRQALLPFLSFFDSQYFVEVQAGWDAPVKSKSRVRSKPKRTFVDPSLPASLLSVTPKRLLLEQQLLGDLFEELCLRDVRVYSSAMGLATDPGVFYYGDADGLEVDLIVELPDGRWGAMEVKLSEDEVPKGVASLMRLRDKVMANPAAQNREPSFMAVLVGKASFKRVTPEGVYVVPITCLGA